MRKWRAWFVLLAVAAAVIGGIPAQAVQRTPTAAVISAGAAGNGTTLLDVVMLVDESGSETPLSVAEEKAAAETITFGMLNKGSQVAVIGFGGVNDDQAVPPQNPVDVTCPPHTASQANDGYFASCISKLHRRTAAEGNDTDYAAALRQAMSYLGPGTTAPAGAHKLIIMMTDGGLDDSHTHQYGWPDWEDGAHHAVDLKLAAANANGVQVWPLGFGTIAPLDQQYLGHLAAGGAQNSCYAKPHAIIVSGRPEALAGFDTLLGEATCSGISNPPPIMIGGGQTRPIDVTIPSIATSAVISVYRADPRVQVAFYPPGSSTPEDFGAAQVSGQGTATEVLQLDNPQPGQWRVQLTAPQGMASELVSATAIFQGALNAYLNATPTVLPGHPVSVTFSVLRPNGDKVTDPGTLAQLRTSVTVTGDGLAGAQPVTVSNAGEGQGTSTGVGDYTGTFTAPRQTGTLTFTGTAAGYDLNVTPISAQVAVSPALAQLNGQVQFPGQPSVQAGGGIHGQVTLTNQTGQPQAVLVVADSSYPGVLLTAPSGRVTVPAGGAPLTEPFTVGVGRGSPPGTAVVTVKVVSASNPGLVYASAQDTVQVTKPPGFWAQYLRWIILAGVLAVLAAVYLMLWRRARNRELLVEGLTASLSRHGEPRGRDLTAPQSGRSRDFRFVIRDETGQNARLMLAQPRDGNAVYEVRRRPPGRVEVVSPDGAQWDQATSGPGMPLPSGLDLAFRDTRKRRKRRPWYFPGIERPGRARRADAGGRRPPAGRASANGHATAASAPAGADGGPSTPHAADPATPTAPSDSSAPPPKSADAPTKQAPDNWY